MIQIDESTMDAARELFRAMDALSAGIPNMTELEIHATINGDALVFGYGESGDPAILIPSRKVWDGHEEGDDDD